MHLLLPVCSWMSQEQELPACCNVWWLLMSVHGMKGGRGLLTAKQTGCFQAFTLVSLRKKVNNLLTLNIKVLQEKCGSPNRWGQGSTLLHWDSVSRAADAFFIVFTVFDTLHILQRTFVVASSSEIKQHKSPEFNNKGPKTHQCVFRRWRGKCRFMCLNNLCLIWLAWPRCTATLKFNVMNLRLVLLIRNLLWHLYL